MEQGPNHYLEVQEPNTISDQMVQPGEDNSVLPNDHIVRQEAAVEMAQMEIADKSVNEPEMDVDQDASKTNEMDLERPNLTEITLNSEQCQMLEQKGWVLLELNNRIFILDVLGLHDITNNTKLIENLKSQISSTQNDNGCEKHQNDDNTSKTLVLTEETEVNTNKQKLTIDNKETIDAERTDDNKEEESTIEPPNRFPLMTRPRTLIMTKPKPKGKIIKLKTNCIFKNIPDKVILGKTIDGYDLVARITVKNKAVPDSKESKPDANSNPTGNNQEEAAKKQDIINKYRQIRQQQLLNATNLHEHILRTLIKQTLQNGPITQGYQNILLAAENVTRQLMRVPSLKSTILKSHLLITRVRLNREDPKNHRIVGHPTLVCGIATAINDIDFNFSYQPDMLRNLRAKKSERYLKTRDNNNEDEESNNPKILHIHVLESKSLHTSVQITVTLNKYSLSDLPMDSGDNKKINVMYACGSCATTFDSELRLKDHQQMQCGDDDNNLTIDTDTTDNVNEIRCYTAGSQRVYECVQCGAKFRRLDNCQRHLKTHLNPFGESGNDNSSESPNSAKMYKCKMCPCFYFHPSTLSKHILTRHILI